MKSTWIKGLLLSSFLFQMAVAIQSQAQVFATITTDTKKKITASGRQATVQTSGGGAAAQTSLPFPTSTTCKNTNMYRLGTCSGPNGPISCWVQGDKKDIWDGWAFGLGTGYDWMCPNSTECPTGTICQNSGASPFSSGTCKCLKGGAIAACYNGADAVSTCAKVIPGEVTIALATAHQDLDEGREAIIAYLANQGESQRALQALAQSIQYSATIESLQEMVAQGMNITELLNPLIDAKVIGQEFLEITNSFEGADVSIAGM